MRQGYPSEERFDFLNFGNQPIWLIEQAVAQMHQTKLVDAYHWAAPIASVGMALCYLKGVKNPDSNWFNPYQQKLFTKNARLTISQATAIIFLDLAQEGLLPTWVGPLVDLELIRAAAE
ncbi:MAG: hypothetical protein V7K76_23020 [Nostoc sp.]|uniref:hypothetical protein n=1 Tax=Nostoc sp. TaxID=1180 RepID=UPI002FF71748